MVKTLKDHLIDMIQLNPALPFTTHTTILELTGWIDGETEVIVHDINIYSTRTEIRMQVNCIEVETRHVHITTPDHIYLEPLDTPAKKVLYGPRK